MINKIGIVGIIFAFLGIVTAIFQDDIRSGLQSVDAPLSAQVLEKSKVLLLGKKEEYARDKVDYAYSILGLIALTLGVVSYLQNENHRISSSAAALGIVAIAWHYVLIGVVIAVVILLLGSGVS